LEKKARHVPAQSRGGGLEKLELAFKKKVRFTEDKFEMLVSFERYRINSSYEEFEILVSFERYRTNSSCSSLLWKIDGIQLLSLLSFPSDDRL
jgi:hypothetical protein